MSTDSVLPSIRKALFNFVLSTGILTTGMVLLGAASS